eukprot:7975166-Pyramimonas_sp.AAC.1
MGVTVETGLAGGTGLIGIIGQGCAHIQPASQSQLAHDVPMCLAPDSCLVRLLTPYGDAYYDGKGSR